MKQVELTVRGDGSIEHIHDDQLTQVTAPLGAVTVSRASHVEQWADLSSAARAKWLADEPDRVTPTGVAWFVDLSPLKGSVFGPFPKHASALKFEAAWIAAHHFTRD